MKTYTTQFLGGLALVLLLYYIQLSDQCDFLESEDDYTCYQDISTRMKREYDSKTVYHRAEDSMNHFDEDSCENVVKNKKKLKKCVPSMLFYFGRHSIRYPDGDKILSMSNNLPKLRDEIVELKKSGKGSLCQKDVDAIARWTMRMVEADDNRVGKTGELETEALATKLLSKYPDLLNPNLVDFNIGVSSEYRTTETARAFVKIINETFTGFNYDFKDNPVVYFHRVCKKKFIQKPPKPDIVRRYVESRMVEKLRKKITARIGFNESQILSFKQIVEISQACSFEFALYKYSPWCALLTDNEWKIVEFYEDVEAYYDDGYGREINTQMTCPLVGDLIQRIRHAINGNNNTKPVTTLYFSHAGALRRLYTAFGLFDSIRVSDDFCPDGKRSWKQSTIIPFNANLMVTLYKCYSDTKLNRFENFKILPTVQGHPVKFKGCDKHLCPVEDFERKYRDNLNCDLNQICKI